MPFGVPVAAAAASAGPLPALGGEGGSTTHSAVQDIVFIIIVIVNES